MKAQDVLRIIEDHAPGNLAASWDNTGWQVGDPNAVVQAVLVALDPAEAVIQEAQDQGCNLIVVHHPLLFRPLRALDPSSPVGGRVARLVRHEIGLWCAHTNLDAVLDGVNGALARALGLEPVSLRPLVPVEPGVYRLELFAPEALTDEVKDRLAVTGLGAEPGQQAHFWESAVNGYLDRGGGLNFQEETAIVGLVSFERLAAIRAAIRDLGPKVSMVLTPVAEHRGAIGWGAVGELPAPMTTDDLLCRVQERLSVSVARVVPGTPSTHRMVAVCGGDGGRFIAEAARSATIYVTGECGYHEAQEAQMLGLTVIEAGHYQTERPVVDRLAEWLRTSVSAPVHVSTADTSPFCAMYSQGASHL